MATHHHQGGGPIDAIEEFLIAVLLGLMTLVTFANVVTRYVFNSNLLWALETTVFLFAWMVLLGTSYALKKNAHLGVDVVIALFSTTGRRVLATIAALCCIAYAFMLLKGSWDYWANFANLPQTTGRWFPTGIEDDYLPKAWYEVNDIEMPDWLQWIGEAMNDGERYEKMPRFIPYFVLPLSMALLLLRSVQAAVQIWRGVRESVIASHEAEATLDELSATVRGSDART